MKREAPNFSQWRMSLSLLDKAYNEDMLKLAKKNRKFFEKIFSKLKYERYLDNFEKLKNVYYLVFFRKKMRGEKMIDNIYLKIKKEALNEKFLERYYNAFKAAVIFLPVLLTTIVIFYLVDENIISDESYVSKILLFTGKGLLTFYISTILWYLFIPLKANIFLNKNQEEINYNYIFIVIALRIGLFFAISQAVSL